MKINVQNVFKMIIIIRYVKIKYYVKQIIIVNHASLKIAQSVRMFIINVHNVKQDIIFQMII